MEYTTTYELAEKLAGLIISRMDKNMIQADAIASGELRNSLNYKVVEKMEGYQVQILAADYFEYVEYGRRPGKIPPINKIKEWCRYRGIPQQAAFPIAKKIGKFGIDPRPILGEVLETLNIQNNREVLQQITDDVEQHIKMMIEKL